MHAYAEQDNYNAQNLNAREIAVRLDKKRFEIVLFYKRVFDSRLINRENIKLVKVSSRKVIASSRVLRELLKRKYNISMFEVLLQTIVTLSSESYFVTKK